MAILGDNSVGSDDFPCSGDRALLQKVTATEAGNINSGHAYFDPSSTAGTSCKVCLYTDTGSGPGTQVAVSSAAAVPAGGGLVNFTMSGSFNATSYYLGIVANGFNSRVQDDGGLSGQDMQMANGTFSYASPPASWPGTDGSYDTIRLNVYLDYTPSGGAASHNQRVIGGGGHRVIGGL